MFILGAEIGQLYGKRQQKWGDTRADHRKIAQWLLNHTPIQLLWLAILEGLKDVTRKIFSACESRPANDAF